MLNQGGPERGDDRMFEDRFADGFNEGFSRSREIFWRDMMRRAGECKLMCDNTDSETIKETMKAMEAAYRNAAELIARSHTVYPGALEDNSTPDDESPSYTVSYNDFFKY